MIRKNNEIVTTMFDKTRQERLDIYLCILNTIARTVHLRGKQAIAFRGHREEIVEKNISQNPGNFIAVIREIAVHNSGCTHENTSMQRQQI